MDDDGILGISRLLHWIFDCDDLGLYNTRAVFC